jgi:hypothetical protein
MKAVIHIDALVEIELSAVTLCRNFPFIDPGTRNRRDARFFQPIFQFIPIRAAANNGFLFEISNIKCGCWVFLIFMETECKNENYC